MPMRHFKDGRRVTCLKETLIENGQKGSKWVELVAETTPAYRNGGDSSGNPTVTQVTTLLIMQNFKA